MKEVHINSRHLATVEIDEVAAGWFNRIGFEAVRPCVLNVYEVPEGVITDYYARYEGNGVIFVDTEYLYDDGLLDTFEEVLAHETVHHAQIENGSVFNPIGYDYETDDRELEATGLASFVLNHLRIGYKVNFRHPTHK